MNTLNQAIVEGTIKKDSRSTDKMLGIMEFVLEASRAVREADGRIVKRVYDIPVRAYDNLADAMEKWGFDGRGLRVVGHLESGSWAFDGKTIFKVFLVADHVEFKPFKV